MKMKKQQLVDQVAFATGHSKTQVREIFDVTAEVVRMALCRGEAVFLLGLGKLSVSSRGERIARNLHTGERVIVPPRNVVLFQASESAQLAANSAVSVA